jgi:hypothetical protein
MHGRSLARAADPFDSIGAHHYCLCSACPRTISDKLSPKGSMPTIFASALHAIRNRLLALLTVSLATACATVSPVAPTNPVESGIWVLDKSASDPVEIKVSTAVSAWQAKLRKHSGTADMAGAGYGGRGRHGGTQGGSQGGSQTGSSGDSGASDLGGADNSGEEFDMYRPIAPDFNAVRHRLIQVLTPPATLKFDIGSDYVRIAGDGMPPRTYHPDEDISRIDEYGTAQIDVGWKGSAFELLAHYSSRASLVEHYDAGPHPDTLQVIYHLYDPMVGKIDITSIYHRG